MKFTLFLVLVIATCSYALKDEDVLQKFEEFQSKFGKSYRSPVEARKRLSIFKENFEKIEAHNILYEEGLKTYRKGVNQFADWTADEMKKYKNRGLSGNLKTTGPVFEKNEKFVIPDSSDWRKAGAVTEVKDQGECGSCWAFSVTGTMEGQLKLVKGELISLSEQNLVDCSRSQGNHGCEDGRHDPAFNYIQQYGIEREEDYPYEAIDAECRANASKVVTKISSYVSIPAGDEEAVLEALVTKGPLSVPLIANDDFDFYSSGIYTDDDNLCEDEYSATNHEVLMVGHGSENGHGYFLLKNSWGKTWGENGYMKLSREPKDLCLILSAARYPLL